MIVKAAIVSDVRHWPISFDEQAGSGGQPGLHDELVWSDAEDAFDEAGEPDRRQAGAFRERTGRNGFIAMGLEKFQRAGEAGRDALAIARSAQIPRDSNDADDDAVMIAHRQFGRQTPARTSMGVPVQFQMIDDCATSADDRLVLVGVKLGEFFREDFLNMTSKQFLLVAATTTFDEGLINGDVTAASVFDKKCGVGNVIE